MIAVRAGLLALVLTGLCLPGYSQGSLLPPGPPGPTMKRLDQVEPRTLIEALPYVITHSGSFYLTTNLTGLSGQDGITVAASQVTLDLNGFTLEGGPQPGHGVVANGRQDVLIRNGVIRQWNNGIDAAGSTRVKLENLRLVSNQLEGALTGAGTVVESCEAASNGNDGIVTGEDSWVRLTHSSGNGGHGIVTGLSSRIEQVLAVRNQGHGVQAGTNPVLVQVTSRHNGLAGISAGAGAHVQSCQASQNQQSGIVAGTDAVVQDCTVSQNGAHGILAGASSTVRACQAVSNATIGIQAGNGSTVRDSAAYKNGEDGIVVSAECLVLRNHCNNNFNARDASGIRVTGTDNTIQENRLISNDRGLTIAVAGNLVIQNAASNNSINYFISGLQSMLPVLGTLPSGPEPPNPLSNLEY